MGPAVSDSEHPSVMPLFPLPNVVALPGVALHLHVFEQRYRDLIGDLDSSDPYFALALVAKGHERSRERNPPLHPIVCPGRVTHLQPLDDGRFFLVVASLGRAHLVAEDQDSNQYRVGQLDWIAPERDREPGFLGVKLEVYEAFERYAETQDNLRGKLHQLRDLDLPLGRLVDMLASCMPLDLDLQRRLLEELDPSSRALLLLTILASVNKRENAGDPYRVH